MNIQNSSQICHHLIHESRNMNHIASKHQKGQEHEKLSKIKPCILQIIEPTKSKKSQIQH